MGIISLEKANHLFWLGRYVERVFSIAQNFKIYYDKMIDIEGYTYQNYCVALDIPMIYESKEDFIRRYIGDATNPDSILTNLLRAFDNAVVLRDEISSETLSYIQLAVDSLENRAARTAPVVEMVKIIDNLFAFWGCADDYVANEECRNIMKCGKYVERLDLLLRLGGAKERVESAHSKLLNRLKRVKIAIDEDSLAVVTRELEQQPDNQKALYYLNRVFML